MNNKVKDIYQKIINNLSINSDAFIYSSEFQTEPIYLRSYKIISEIVEDPDLTPIPKDFFIQILKKIKTKTNNKISFSYQEIYNQLNDYDYEFTEQFKNNLLKYNKFNGKLTIAILNNDLDIFHQFIDEEFDFIKTQQLFNVMQSQPTGIIDSWGKNLNNEIFQQKNILIINRDLILNNQQWKDSLQHELTHFIQRIVGLDKTLKRVVHYTGQKSISKFKNNFINIFNNIVNQTKLNKANVQAGLNRLINYIFKLQQIQPNIKSCINYFQRMYENSKISFQGKKFKLNLRQLQDRQTWLNNILNKLNQESFYSSQYFMNLFDKYFFAKKSSLSYQNTIEYKKMFCYLIYIIMRSNNVNIQEKIREHFKKIKIRDI